MPVTVEDEIAAEADAEAVVDLLDRPLLDDGNRGSKAEADALVVEVVVEGAVPSEDEVRVELDRVAWDARRAA